MIKLLLGRFIAFGAVLLLVGARGWAGDAVAVGYNKDGIWTAATYYSSSTQNGGADYRNEADARAAAERDLMKRASEGVVRTEIIASSDRTGHVAYARGKTGKNAPAIHVVGYGGSKRDAEQQAREQLERKGAKREQEIVFRYFSHGADAAAPPSKK